MVGSTHPTQTTQPLPWTPVILHLQRGEMSLGLVASFTPWYTGHRGAQEGEKGCQKAELAYLHGLAGGLLRKHGS